MNEYDYIVINDDLDTCVTELHAMIEAARNEPVRRKDFIERIQKELNGSSSTVVAKAKEFLGIESDIDIQNMRVSDIQQLLEKR